jgi:hypothetical protein
MPRAVEESRWDDAEWHQAFAGWAGVTVSVLTLIVVWLQLRGLNIQLRSAALQGIWSAWIDIDKWFAEHADRARFRRHYYPRRSTALADGDDPDQVDAVSEMLLDCYANIYAQRAVLPHDFERLSGYMQAVYRNQPVFRDFVDHAATWYDPAFIAFLQAGATSSTPPPPPTSPPSGGSPSGTTTQQSGTGTGVQSVQ